jgi:hypothetical protein
MAPLQCLDTRTRDGYSFGSNPTNAIKMPAHLVRQQLLFKAADLVAPRTSTTSKSSHINIFKLDCGPYCARSSLVVRVGRALQVAACFGNVISWHESLHH